jgi:hypothetical protein
LLRKILRIFCLALVYEEQDGEALASCLQSLSKQLKRMEALYRNVHLPESVHGKGGWRSYAQALVRARCRIEDKNLNICLNEDGALGFVRMLISKRSSPVAEGGPGGGGGSAPTRK